MMKIGKLRMNILLVVHKSKINIKLLNIKNYKNYLFICSGSEVPFAKFLRGIHTKISINFKMYYHFFYKNRKLHLVLEK
jgi:hypothetical protein